MVRLMIIVGSGRRKIPSLFISKKDESAKSRIYVFFNEQLLDSYDLIHQVSCHLSSQEIFLKRIHRMLLLHRVNLATRVYP